MTALQLKGIGHAYLGRTILEGIDLDVSSGEMIALVGPSGCGKSTLAHIAARLIEPRNGKINIDYKRHAMVFQEPSLLPWATARDNIAFSMKLAGVRATERKARLENIAAQAALEPEDLDKFPVELSGGMRQRVAIARALAVQPDFIFFDEPFTALDVALKRRMQDLVIQSCYGGQMGGLFITHDLVEAARLADKIAILDTNGAGILGSAEPPGSVGARSDQSIYEWVQSALDNNPLFHHIHDVDERRLA